MVGLVGVGIRYCYKMKIENCKCCGFDITRNIQIELTEDMETNRRQSNIV
jgi:hypothetical protein